MHPAFLQTDHRAWAVPARRWAWRHVWHDLLFAHWPVPADVLRPHVPAGLAIDQFDGVAWVGVVPFRMSGVMRRGLPSMPWISSFPELNVRTYVERDGKPGVWFMSLDATNRLAIWMARRFFHLPYTHARMRFEKHGNEYHARSQRVRLPAARFEGRFAPITAPRQAAPGTLEHFLIERYCLYAAGSNGTLYRGEVHHAPWPLQDARAELDAAGLLASQGLVLDGPPAHTHFARRVDVVIWPLEPLAG